MHRFLLAGGPIPAVAGETRAWNACCIAHWAYPRGRGGNKGAADWLIRRWGLSPRSRGKLTLERSRIRAEGPIPAVAGETQPFRRPQRANRAYPRGRGGNLAPTIVDRLVTGLSPRSRGKHVDGRGSDRAARPIPAVAGETAAHGFVGMHDGAYPRGRGGNNGLPDNTSRRPGLSPRSRGKR